MCNNNFRKAIDRANISPSEAAKELGYKNYSTYRKVETGEKGISINKLILLSKLTNCSTDYLLGLTNNPKKAEDLEQPSLSPLEELKNLTQQINQQQSNTVFFIDGGEMYSNMSEEEKNNFKKSIQDITNISIDNLSVMSKKRDEN